MLTRCKSISELKKQCKCAALTMIVCVCVYIYIYIYIYIYKQIYRGGTCYENELYWPGMYVYEEFVIVTEAPQCIRITATGHRQQKNNIQIGNVQKAKTQ